MDRYIGLDTHTQSCSLGLVGPSGKRLRVEVVETSATALIEAVRRVPGKKHLCLEEGTLSEWLCEVLAPYVDELVVTVPKKRPGNKNDAEDAWALAEALRRGAIDVRVFKPAGMLTELREAVRAYRVLTRDATRAKNRLKAVLRSRGLHVEGNDLYAPASRTAWIERLPAERQALATLLGQEVDNLSALHLTAAEWLDRAAKAEPIVQRLATAPGLALVRAAQVVAVVVTPHRFRTKRQFWSYCGLAVVMRSSSDYVRDGARWTRKQVLQTRGLNRNRQPVLKAVFKGAALTVVTKMADHPLTKSYQKMLEAGTKPNLALVTIARRIAAAVLAMWKSGEVYQPTKHGHDITG
jgi:transposase